MNNDEGICLRSYHVSKNPIKGVNKSSAIWGLRSDKNELIPLAYLKKPKALNDKQWEKIVNSISLNITNNILK